MAAAVVLPEVSVPVVLGARVVEKYQNASAAMTTTAPMIYHTLAEEFVWSMVFSIRDY